MSHEPESLEIREGELMEAGLGLEAAAVIAGKVPA
jgi:hypothetical protein